MRHNHMRHNHWTAILTALVFPLAVAACGGGEQAGEAEGGEQAAGERDTAAQQASRQGLQQPDWYQVDEANQTVTLDLVAGETNANNAWNYNGLHSGNATIVVPQGYEVTINFENADQVNPHSISIESSVGDYPPVFEQADPVFEGAMTEGATEMANATQPGQSETITFTASEAGEYAMVCLVPAHAAQGMWLRFDVSADGESGVRMGG